jgi:GAF domain-containing protein
LARFDDMLRREGVAAGLGSLNARVPHRYTAVYQLDAGKLKNLFLHDKAGETRPEYLAEVDLDVSFCQFVLCDGFFLTENSSSDKRLDGHPYQGRMVSYHGVPLLDNAGELFGSLCHFDIEERGLSSVEFDFLQHAARVLPGYVVARSV